MAREYHLTCTTCKEFLDIHKLKIESSTDPLGMYGVPLSLAEIESGIHPVESVKDTHPWIAALLPIIRIFSMQHADHDLRIIDDNQSDYYWWPEHPGYTEWKEISASSDTLFFLPRNLVDDLRITDWKTAENYLKSSPIVLYEELELIEYREKFDQLTSIK